MQSIKIFARLFAAFITLLALPALGQSRPVITIATGEYLPLMSELLPNYGPFSHKITRVFEAAGYEVRFDFVPWNRAMQKTMSGDYVASSGWFDTPERRETLYYPHTPVLNLSTVAFYNRDEFPDGPKGKTLADYTKNGYRFVGIRSFWYMEQLNALSADVHVVSNSTLAWRFLDKGRADLIIETLQTGKAEMEKTLGEGVAAYYAHTHELEVRPMYLLFSRVHPNAKFFRDLWDKHAPVVLKDDS